MKCYRVYQTDVSSSLRHVKSSCRASAAVSPWSTAGAGRCTAGTRRCRRRGPWTASAGFHAWSGRTAASGGTVLSCMRRRRCSSAGSRGRSWKVGCLDFKCLLLLLLLCVYQPIVVIETSTVRHSDDFSVGGQRAAVQGAASHCYAFSCVVWKFCFCLMYDYIFDYDVRNVSQNL